MARLRLAVVIAAHQAAPTLHQTLGALAAQRRVPDDVLVVDDCSSDGTGDVAARFGGVLPVQVLRTPTNVGPGGARHLGIMHTDAELIAILDADDVALPDHLQQLELQHERRGGLVTAEGFVWRPGTGLERRTMRQWKPLPPVPQQRRAIIASNFVTIATLFHRELYERAGGFRDRTGVEDWDLWQRMIFSGAPVSGTSMPTWLYRISSSSLSASGRQGGAELQLLEERARALPTPEERALAAEAARRLRARHRLEAAQRERHRGHKLRARRLAVGAIRGGDRGTQARAIGLAVLPAAVDHVKRMRSGRALHSPASGRGR